MSKYYIDSVSKNPNHTSKPHLITFELEPLFLTAIKKFKEKNSVPPAKIIIYENSLSNERIFDRNISQLKLAIEKLKTEGGVYSENEHPQLIFMKVT